MEINVNWMAVVLAMASSMVVGSIWYARSVFGDMWIKLAKVDMKRKGAGMAIMVTAIVSLLTAYVLAHLAFLAHSHFGESFLNETLTVAFWGWAGLTAARFITHDAFEGRPLRLTLLNCAHEFVTVMVMALIIGMMPPAL